MVNIILFFNNNVPSRRTFSRRALAALLFVSVLLPVKHLPPVWSAPRRWRSWTPPTVSLRSSRMNHSWASGSAAFRGRWRVLVRVPEQEEHILIMCCCVCLPLVLVCVGHRVLHLSSRLCPTPQVFKPVHLLRWVWNPTVLRSEAPSDRSQLRVGLTLLFCFRCLTVDD